MMLDESRVERLALMAFDDDLDDSVGEFNELLFGARIK